MKISFESKFKSLLLVLSTLSIAYISNPAYSCDEQCMKTKVEKEKSITFAKHLSWKFCETTRNDFMTSSIKSLDNYRSKHFNPKNTRGMKNIRQYIAQRKAWLEECDQYLSYTKKERIFGDDKTTDKIYYALDNISKELGDILAGVSYSGTAGESTEAIVGEKFDGLIQIVSDHKTLMHLKGRYVFSQ